MAAPHPGRGGRARRCSAASLLIGCQPSASDGWSSRSPASPLWGRLPGCPRWPATTPTQFSVCADGLGRSRCATVGHGHFQSGCSVMNIAWSRWLFGAWAVLAAVWLVVATLMLVQTRPEHRGPPFGVTETQDEFGVRPDDEGASQHSRATARQEFPAVCDPASRIPVAARLGRAAHRRAAFSLPATGEPGQASKPQVGLETCCSVAFGA